MRNISFRSILSLFVLSVVAVSGAVPAYAKAPAGRYVVSTDGRSVLDTKTKLTWQQSAPGATYTWAAGKSYCADTTNWAFLGGTGWRLPTVKELMTVLDYSLSSTPMFDSSVFAQNSQLIRYWTSTPHDPPPTYAWMIDVWLGTSGFTAVTDTNGIRCVR